MSTTVKGKQPRKSRASMRGTARHIINAIKIAEEKGEKPTDQQKKSLEWALKFLEEDEQIVQYLKDSTASKRNRSLEGSFEEPKRHKPVSDVKNIDGLPLSEIVKQHLKVCIVDTAAVDWHITVENFGLIEKQIMRSIINLMKTDNIDPPGYEMSERYHGFRLILCETQFALDFLQKCISSLSPPWEGAKIELKSLKDLPAPRKIRILIPDLDIPKEDVLDVLIRSNRNLPISSWKLIHMGDTIRGRKLLLFRADDENLTALESQDSKIKYSVRKIKAFVSKHKSLESVLTEGDQFEKELDEEMAEQVTELVISNENGNLSGSNNDSTLKESHSMNSTFMEHSS